MATETLNKGRSIHAGLRPGRPYNAPLFDALLLLPVDAAATARSTESERDAGKTLLQQASYAGESMGIRLKLESTACSKKAMREAPKAFPGLVRFSRRRPRVEETRRDAPAVARGVVPRPGRAVAVAHRDVADDGAMGWNGGTSARGRNGAGPVRGSRDTRANEDKGKGDGRTKTVAAAGW